MTQSHHVPTFPPQEGKLITRKQLAKRHDCTVETVKRRDKTIYRPLKIGRTVRYRLEDILELEKNSEVV
jgi:hypothetical protein